MTKAEYVAHVRALAMDPQAFIEKFESDAKKKGLVPTRGLMLNLLNKLYKYDVIGTLDVMIIGIYYYSIHE